MAKLKEFRNANKSIRSFPALCVAFHLSRVASITLTHPLNCETPRALITAFGRPFAFSLVDFDIFCVVVKPQKGVCVRVWMSGGTFVYLRHTEEGKLERFPSVMD